MTVLFVLARYPAYGGIEKVTTILCNCLSESIEWCGIYSFEQQNEQELMAQLSSKVHLFKSEIPGQHCSNQNAGQLATIIRKNAVDIVIYQDSYAYYFITVVKALKGVNAKLVVVEHNTPEQSLKSTPLLDVIKQNRKNNVIRSILAYYKGRFLTYYQHIYKYYKCDKYVLLSEKFVPTFKKLVPFASSEKLISINNPSPLNPIFSSLEKKKICLFCARLEPQKGIDYLIDIWTIIENRRKDWQLIIVGNGSQYQKIVDCISQRNLTNIQMMGYQSDTSNYYSQASIFLMTSIFEGWGMTIVEAKTHGCVPIAFNSYASATDVINDGIDGILIAPFDVNKYADNLLMLMDDYEKRKELSINAINDSQRFSIEIIKNQWIALFQSLIEK